MESGPSRSKLPAAISTGYQPSAPSPLNSPAPDGLSRRQSWTQRPDDRPNFSAGMTSGYSQGQLNALAPTTTTRGSNNQEADIGDIWGRRSSEPEDINTASSSRPFISHHSSSYQPEPHDKRPYFHQFDSSTSFDTTPDDELSHPMDEVSLHRLKSSQSRQNGYDDLYYHTSNPYAAGPSRSRSQRRPYDENGHAGGIARSPTLRMVSDTIRRASMRVAGMVGGDKGKGNRIPSTYEEDSREHSYELDNKDMKELEEDEPPDKDVYEATLKSESNSDGLRGRTLCLFGPRSGIRSVLSRMLRWAWTEAVILILIILYAVVLTIQAAPPLNNPRSGGRYFQSWEDWVIFVIFVIFTAEMFARIIATGLIFDPETSVRQWLFAPAGIVPRVNTKVRRVQQSIESMESDFATRRAGWRTAGPGKQQRRKTTILSEAPFQEAVQKQQHLSAAGRPYLRHSWHRIDMLSIVCYWINFFLATTQKESQQNLHLYIFRALSILRIGRLMAITSGTTTVLDSFKRAGPLLITVAFFVTFAAFLFSIVGVQSFRGSFRRMCVLADPNNSTNLITLSQACGGYLDQTNFSVLPFLKLDGLAYKDGAKGYTCPIDQICQTESQNPEAGNQSFDNFFYSLIQIVVIASINTWTPVMYQAMDSDYYASALFWIVGVIVINFWLINLVVAVVVNTFKGVRASTKKSAFGADDSTIGVDPNWAADKSKTKKEKVLLKYYRKTEYFWVLLVLASLASQAVKTNESTVQQLEILKNIELGLTLAFDAEIIFRIFAYFPDWRDFLSSPRNNFDLFLAVMSSIIQIPPIAANTIYPWFTIFQLARWYRFVLAFPRMKPLLLRIFGNFAGLLNVTIFLFIIVYLSAMFAMQLFRGDMPDDDLISFSQPYNSFLGMYQIFSSENWTDILYSAMESEEPFNQKWIAAILLCCWIVFSYFIVLQMFVAVINENFDIAEEQKRKQQVADFIKRGAPQSAHISWIDRLNPYRLVKARQNAVRVEALPQNLVLPLKQTVGQDVGSAPDSAASSGIDYTKGMVLKMFGREKDDNILRYRKKARSRLLEEDDLADREDERGLTDILPILETGAGQDEAADAERERRNQQADFIAAHPSFDHSLWIFKQSNPIRRFCQACFDPAYGDRIFGRPAHPVLRLIAKFLMFATIVASVVVAALSTPIYRKYYYRDNGYFRGAWFDLVEAGLSSMFLLEAIMKIIADGFMFAPNAYILSVWNILDFVILLGLLVNMMSSLIIIGGLNRFTRALRGVRALRLITLFSRLRDTLHVVLFAGFINIVDASVLMILYIIPFAVWGLNIFSGLLFSCTDTSVTGAGDCFGETQIQPVDPSLSFLAPRVWANPGLIEPTTVWNFDSFRGAVLILFEIVSLEGWIDVMQSAMSIVGRDFQPQINAAQWNSIFFIIFNLFGAVIILTLFVSIIIENFSISSGQALLTIEQSHWSNLTKFIKAQSPSQLPKIRPEEGIRSWCYNRATEKHGWWARMFTLIYYLHIILLAFEDFNNTIFNDAQIDAIFLGLTIIYAIDLLVRFVGVGLPSFWANGWNLFDLIVITGSFVTTIPALQAASRGEPGNQVNVQLQKLFLVAIALKLVQRNSLLNQLFKTSVASLPAIGNLFLLWACLFIFYAIMFVEVFGLTKIGTNQQSRFQNYFSFGNAILMLSFMSTGEGWNGFMHNSALNSPRCTEAENFLNSDCGSPGWAYFLFISWNILSMYIFLNMFTGVVVESFAYVYQMPGGISLDREQMRAFKKVWSDFDVKRSGYIRRKDFVSFFRRLTGVFEVRIYPSHLSLQNLARSSIPDPIDNAAGRVLAATGVKRVVDVRRMETIIKQTESERLRERRKLFNRLLIEARISEEPGRGLSFESMLFMLAHYKLIDDEKALLLDDLLARRNKIERVTDLVNLDRIRGLLQTLYWRKEFLKHRESQKRTLNAEGHGIPAIVLQTSDSPGKKDTDFYHYSPPTTPRSSNGSAPGSPRLRSGGSHEGGSGSASPRGSIASSVEGWRLSAEDAGNKRSWSDEEYDMDGNGDAGHSIWGDMMQEAVEKEEGLTSPERAR